MLPMMFIKTFLQNEVGVKTALGLHYTAARGEVGSSPPELAVARSVVACCLRVELGGLGHSNGDIRLYCLKKHQDNVRDLG